MITAELDLERPLIFELPAVFTAAECAGWIARIQSAGTELATINTKRGSQVDSQIRNNRRVIFDDREWANTLFERVKDQVPQTIHDMSVAGVNERLRCYEYHQAIALRRILTAPSFVMKASGVGIPTWCT